MTKLSIIIPVFNEENTIKDVVKRVKKAKVPLKVSKEIIVVDDASNDSTLKILKRMKGIRLITHEKNLGKGGAVKTGIRQSSGDIVIIQDADLEYDPKYYDQLLSPILSGKAEVVYGTRLKNYPLKISGMKRTPLILHYLGNRFLSFVTNVLYGSVITDMETGYKVFKKEVLHGITISSRGFDLEPEITAKILKKDLKIYEVPIKVKPRGYDEGKKITWVDGIQALWTLIKYRFVD